MRWAKGLRNLLLDNQSGLKGIVQDDISTNVYKKIIVYGNGESRLGKVWPTSIPNDIETWGCNAIYRDMKVDNLVSVDYNMQQEIYQSKYAHNNTCWFSDWEILPAFSGIVDIMRDTNPPEMIKETPRVGRGNVVIQGKEPETVHANVKQAMEQNPDLDYKYLKQKAEMNIGIYITWVDDNDMVKGIDYPIGWSAGNTALHLACQGGANEIYMLGFDSSDYSEPLNNVYKGSDNYLPETAKGFNPVNWNNQLNTIFNEYTFVNFKWVNPIHKMISEYPNVEYITYEDLYNNIR